MNEKDTMLFILGAIISVIVISFLVFPDIRINFNAKVEQTSSWADTDNDKTAAVMMQDDYYIVTIDGKKHYCNDIEYISGFPMIIILHRGDDTRTEKADKSIVVEHR